LPQGILPESLLPPRWTAETEEPGHSVRAMEYQDKFLKCLECGTEFVFTAGEQAFFADKGFRHEPKRCKNCKSSRASGASSGGQGRTETRAICSQCGKETTVPFKPTQGRPVYCRECFQLRRAMTNSG